MDYIYEIVIGIILSILFFLRSQLIKIFGKFVVKILRHHYHTFNKETIKNYQLIQTLLIEISQEFDADSVCIHQFHNGQIFASNNPIWKISCSHEYVKSGLEKSAEYMQNIPASSTALFLSSVEKGEDLYGIDIHECTCEGKQDCINKFQFMSLFHIDDMPDIMLKRARMVNDYKFSLLKPIHKDGNIIGFLEILSRKDDPFIITKGMNAYICNFTSKISYILSSQE